MVDYNCKTQAHARVCEENNEELEEKTMPTETIMQLKVEFEGSYRKSGEVYQDDTLMDDLNSP